MRRPLSLSWPSPPRRPATGCVSVLVGLTVVSLLLAACGGDDGGIRIAAITSTPTPSTTAEAEGTGSPTATEADETPVPLPDLPENPFAGGRLVERYIAPGNANLRDCLPELVEAWGMAPEVDGPRCVMLDLDGDRRDEWVLLVSFGTDAEDESPYPADLWFFQDADEDYRFYNSARALANATTAGLRIRLVEDLTNDGIPELVLTWQDCGAHTCVTQVTIPSYHTGELEDLAPADASIETLEEFEIVDGVIRMSGGQIGSVGAGPQRPSTTVVRWAGARFRTETVEGEATYLVHLVNDADRLFNVGAYADARDAYLDASRNETLPDWKAEIGEQPGRSELQAYAAFRASLASFRLNALVEGVNLMENAADGFPQTMHGAAAMQYLAALDEGQSPQQACSAVETFLDLFRDLYVEFWNFGYANPERTVFTLCR